ncbi:MAG TPA: CDP-glucose 4,6-dehydratase [Solirubrobacteraceae bacterium]|nr:CDP-glucose 4,6-dehydratase [Solirubrobacteraceae bacterium]
MPIDSVGSAPATPAPPASAEPAPEPARSVAQSTGPTSAEPERTAPAEPAGCAPTDADFWAGRRVLLTGHTGFKGAWLSLWLQQLGARVSGLAPGAPTSPSLYELARVGEGMREIVADVRDARAVRDALARERPEVVLHLAAQPLVRLSHREPALTYEVNVMGTVNVLDAVRLAGENVRAVVVVTSDKCYENTGGGRRFVEGDPLGGADPYSSSKACAELVTAAYRSSFFATGPRLASSRAGNVIGGGDWGADRLIPDIVRAVAAGEPVRVRNPNAVRPWQHVLNPLGGYLALARALHCEAEAGGGELAGAWNFGPPAADARTVGWMVQRLAEHWDGALRWESDPNPGPPEAGHLALDSSRAERMLGWCPAWNLEQALRSVVEWHRALWDGADARQTTVDQIGQFDQVAR